MQSSSNADSNRSELARQLNLSHPLVQLAKSLDWPSFEDEFGRACKPSGGRPSLPTRLMVGLHCLKALYDESDESVVAKWVENPYWQYFCGETMFQHELPCHPTSLVKWRKQVGTEGIELLLGQVVRSAMSTAMLRPREIERVNVDATVQEKAVAFPTDALALSAGEEDAGTRGKKEKYKIASKLCPRWQVRFLQAKSLPRG